MSNRIEQIRAKLIAALSPVSLEIEDDSHLHAGHAGARGGGGHYTVHIVSSAFEGRPPLARHRQVYAALEDMMQKEIHALSIKASTP
ncbi:MAG TPA: BolA family transcriptional regulator [Gammaproteobacteria bacterium]|nr:BolA family transcriptional regulator [Gammaproteobacteria bacterium]